MIKIIILILVILLIIYLLTTSNYENYKNMERCYILSRLELIDFFINDEDNYLKNLSKYDLYARHTDNLLQYSNNILNTAYDIDLVTKNRLINLTQKADEYFKYHPEIQNINWIISVYDGDIYENGLPHTRQNIIFLSNNIFNKSDNEIIKTLIHEKIHIFQRYNPKHIYITDFLIKNRFKKYMSKNEYMKTYPLVRANPDLDEWIYMDDYNIYDCQYKTTIPKSITDITCKSEKEHPFELFAYQLTNLLMQ